MLRSLLRATTGLAWLLLPSIAAAEPAATEVSYAQVVEAAGRSAPELAVARWREASAQVEIGVAGIIANPTFFGGTTTQTAKFIAGVSVPLQILGQRSASVSASRAEAETVAVDTALVRLEVRTAAKRAFVALWRAEKIALARDDAAALARRVEESVAARVELGSSPRIDQLRARSERLRAEADATEGRLLIAAASADLARWMGAPGGELRTVGEATVPEPAPSLASLGPRVSQNPSVLREEAEARAAQARAGRERALVRPLLTLDLSLEARDPTLPGTNYRAQLGIEIPIFNQRGPLVRREELAGSLARARAGAERIRQGAAVVAAYRTWEATSARFRALRDAVAPATELAASATEESYSLGHAPLVAVLDAARSRIEVRLTLIETQAARADAWIDVERAVGDR